jgi:hypothetical protein
LKYELADKTAFKDSLIRAGYLYHGKKITDENSADDNFKHLVDSLYEKYAASFTSQKFMSIKALREKYKDELWNKFKFETAFALKFSSADSLVRNSHYSKFQIYNTIALPIGKSGQCLLGLNVASARYDSIHPVKTDSVTMKNDTVRYTVTHATLAARLYAGSNNFKMFLEGSGKYGSDKMANASLNMGAELNLSDGLWVVINIGNNWKKDTDVANSKWVDGLFWKIDLRFHIPEKKKI